MHYWFRPKRFLGWFAFYVPVSLSGWVTSLILFAMGVVFFLLIDGQERSLGDTLMNFAPWAIMLMIIFDMLCFRFGEYPSWWRKK